MGIDGCRSGWVMAFRIDGEIQFETSVDLPSLNGVLTLDASVMIDMPIGLLREGGTRHCDALARAQLRPYRSSSVFGVPAREVARCTDYAEANALSRTLSGKGLSKQSFYLFPKIRELDRWLAQPKRNGVWHECHPRGGLRVLERWCCPEGEQEDRGGSCCASTVVARARKCRKCTIARACDVSAKRGSAGRLY